MSQDYSALFKSARQAMGLNTAKMGEVLGISGRTVEGIEQGRPPPKPVLFLLQEILRTRGLKKRVGE